MARTKGSKNKDKEEFRAKLRRYCLEHNVDPFEYMASIIKRPGIAHSLKVTAAKEIAQYLQPKLRSVEVTGNPDKPLMVMSPDERQRRIQELETKRQQRIEPLSIVDPE